MNDKKAKSLRKIARMSAVGLPAKAYEAVNIHDKDFPIVYTGLKDPEPPIYKLKNGKFIFRLQVYQIKLKAACERFIYKQLKVLAQ